MAVIGSERLTGANLGPFLLVDPGGDVLGLGQRAGEEPRQGRHARSVVWSSLAAPLPLFLLSLAFEGAYGLAALAHPSWKLIISVLTISYGGTVFGYGVWAWLLARHSAATVAPFALLVPVIGMIAGAVLFGETLTPVELVGGALVMAGLALNILGDWVVRTRRRFANGRAAARTQGLKAETSPRHASGRSRWPWRRG